jgi:hypothetical protein
MESRRVVLKALAAGATAAALPSLAGPSLRRALSGNAEAGQAAEAIPAWDLVAPLRGGDVLALGWHLQDLSPLAQGAAILTLVSETGQARVHLCRNGGSPRGVAHTRDVDLLLMNGGQGDRPTDEPLGRVVLGIAEVIAANEDKPSVREITARLWTHDERLRAHAAGTAGALA